MWHSSRWLPNSSRRRRTTSRPSGHADRWAPPGKGLNPLVMPTNPCPRRVGPMESEARLAAVCQGLGSTEDSVPGGCLRRGRSRSFDRISKWHCGSRRCRCRRSCRSQGHSPQARPEPAGQATGGLPRRGRRPRCRIHWLWPKRDGSLIELLRRTSTSNRHCTLRSN
jgi:hypothetical protein